MLHLEIITPDRIAYTDEVDMVVVPSSLGRLGILPKHIPLFALLVEGELKIKKNKEDYYLSIGGGFIEVTKSKVTILVTRAVHAKELNEQEIIRAKNEAQTALKQKLAPENMKILQASLRQSIVDLRLLQKRKHHVH